MRVRRRAAMLLIGFMLLATALSASGVRAYAAQEDKVFLLGALDGAGEAITSSAALLVRDSDGITIYADGSVVSDEAEQYVLLNVNGGESYLVEYVDGGEIIACFAFADEMPSQSTGAQLGEPVKNEILDVPYVTSEAGTGSFYVALTVAKVSGESTIIMDGVIVDANGNETSAPSDLGAFPLGMYNADGEIVALMTSDGIIIPFLKVDVDEFNGSGSGDDSGSGSSGGSDSPAPQQNDPDAGEPSQSDPAAPGRSGRQGDGQSDDPADDSSTKMLTIALVAVVFLALIGLLVFFILKNRKKPQTPQMPQMPQTPPSPYEDKWGSAPSNYSDTTPIPTPPPAPAPMPADAWTEVHVMGIAGGMRGRSYPLGNEGILIGRAETAGIRYPADTKGVSRTHCRLYRAGDEIYLMDCGSTYGTFVSGYGKLPPQQPIAIKKGTCFYLGSRQDGFMIQ